MTTEQFKTTWTSIEDNLSVLKRENLVDLNLSQSTIDFLTTCGLPNDAAPFLTFCSDTDDIFEGINKLTNQYDFLEPEFDKYVVIGSSGNGDPIAINTENNDQVVLLDHEDNFSSIFFNSTILTLAECLVVYRDFILTIQKENGEDALMNSDFTDEQFEKLNYQLEAADDKALTESGFWKDQLEMELVLRQDSRREK